MPTFGVFAFLSVIPSGNLLLISLPTPVNQKIDTLPGEVLFPSPNCRTQPCGGFDGG